MTTDALIFFGVLLFAAAASGYWLARARPAKPPSSPPAAPQSEYFRGLRYLVDEQPDRAIEVFTKLLAVDSETLETHFALASLFRRRGETERAIRIHQNIIARPELAKADKERALFALGEDYLKAGLLDRAEALFRESAEIASLSAGAFKYLVEIYEQQKDWHQAIKCRQALATSAGARRDPVIAHYHCELAREALDRQQPQEARAELRKARDADPDGVRGLLMRAELARQQDDFRTERRLLLRIIEQRPEFARLAISRMGASFRAAGDKAGLEKALRKMLSRQPDLALKIAHAAVLDWQMDDAISQECFREYLRSDRMLGAILEALTAREEGQSGPDRPEAQRQIRLALRRIALDGPRYGCLECGYTGRELQWRCPSCRTWDSTLPTANLKFESHLGSEGYIQ